MIRTSSAWYDNGSRVGVVAWHAIDAIPPSYLLVQQLLQKHACLEWAEEFARSLLSSAVAVGSSLASESTTLVADGCFGNVKEWHLELRTPQSGMCPFHLLLVVNRL